MRTSCLVNAVLGLRTFCYRARLAAICLQVTYAQPPHAIAMARYIPQYREIALDKARSVLYNSRCAIKCRRCRRNTERYRSGHNGADSKYYCVCPLRLTSTHCNYYVVLSVGFACFQFSFLSSFLFPLNFQMVLGILRKTMRFFSIRRSIEVVITGLIRNQFGGQLPRGFESHLLRHRISHTCNFDCKYGLFFCQSE